MTTKQEMYESGVRLVRKWCRANSITIPEIEVIDGTTRYAHVDACAWYRMNQIKIKLYACASIGYGGASWSYPGYVIDRTPHGVLCHELGHHVDLLTGNIKGQYSSDYCQSVMKESGECKLTNYCPNPAEWFAEMFRLFVTNPDLMRKVRPKTYAILRERFNIVEKRRWQKVIAGAPARTIAQAEKKIQSRAERKTS